MRRLSAPTGIAYKKYPRVWILACVYAPVGLGWHCTCIEFHPCQNATAHVIPVTILAGSLLIGQIPETTGMFFINTRPTLVHTLAHASGPLKCIRTAYVSANVALGAVHWRNVDRSLATCGGQIALIAINTTIPMLLAQTKQYMRS